MIQLQQEIEFKYSKRSISDVVRAQIEEDSPIIHEMYEAIQKYKYGEYSYESKSTRINNLLVPSLELAEEIAVLVLPIKTVSPIQAVCALLGAQLGYDNLLDGIKTAAELLAVCEPAGLYTIYHSSSDENDTGTLAIEPNYQVDASVRDFIDKTKYLPPMLCRPLRWTSKNRYGGNILGSGSVILGGMNHNEEHQELQVIHALQNIPWELNARMLTFVETSKKALDTHEKKANFNFMRTTSEEVYRDLLDQGNKFYFPWKRDSRGRSYSQGYHVNLQASGYKKAILNFHNKEVLTDEIHV